MGALQRSYFSKFARTMEKMHHCAHTGWLLSWLTPAANWPRTSHRGTLVLEGHCPRVRRIDKGCVGENWVSCWDSVCGKQDKRR